MKVTIRTLSPLHIGSGEEISPLEYLMDRGMFYRLDMDGLFADPEFQRMKEQFISSSGSQRYVGSLLPRDVLARHVLYRISIAPNASGVNPINVKACIKSMGRIYIPGSSIKGSILSAVMEKVLYQKRVQSLSDFESLLSTVIGEMTAMKDKGRFSRWLDVTDTECRPIEEAAELTSVKIFGAKTRKAMPMLVETIKKDTAFTAELKTSLSPRHTWGSRTEAEIVKMADEFYRKVYAREEKYAREHSLPQMLPPLPSDAFVARLGQGSTAYATSFLILADELGIRDYTIQRPRLHKQEGPPRTRKLSSGTTSMGWVAIYYS